MRMRWPSNSYRVMFLPTSPRPPSGMMRSASLTVVTSLVGGSSWRSVRVGHHDAVRAAPRYVAAVDVLISTASDGRIVAEVDLTSGDPAEAVARARADGASLVWAYGGGELERQGFRRAGAYRRLHA